MFLRKTKTPFNYKYLIPTIKHGDGNVMVLGHFTLSRPGQLTSIESTMNSSGYKRVMY